MRIRILEVRTSLLGVIYGKRKDMDEKVEFLHWRKPSSLGAKNYDETMCGTSGFMFGYYFLSLGDPDRLAREEVEFGIRRSTLKRCPNCVAAARIFYDVSVFNKLNKT
jgi:hypothetical protein